MQTVDVTEWVLEKFLAQLTEEERPYVWFQPDSATAHTADDSVVALEGLFGDNIISLGLWPARSPDLTPRDFYLWCNLKDRVQKEPQYKRTRKGKHEETFCKFLRKKFVQVNFSVFKRCTVYVCVQGYYSQHLLKYRWIYFIVLWSDSWLYREASWRLAVSHAVPAGSRQVTAAPNFIFVRTVLWLTTCVFHISTSMPHLQVAYIYIYRCFHGN
jgi:hypothetical protein